MAQWVKAPAAKLFNLSLAFDITWWCGERPNFCKSSFDFRTGTVVPAHTQSNEADGYPTLGIH